MPPPSRPLLIFDGQCGFCRAWVERWQGSIRGHVDVAPSQEVGASYPEIPAARFAESVVLLEPDGAIHYGAAAVFRALAHAPRRGLAWWAYRRIPGVAPLSETCYRAVARHRDIAGTLSRLLWGRHVAPPGERLTAWIFVRLVGVNFLVAFASLVAQIRGLAGHDGILPAAEYLGQLGARMGPIRFLMLPTLAWLNASDGFLIGLSIAGMLAAALAIAGLAPRAMLLLAWASYLSLAGVAGEFLWFQWDGLILECGVAAALLTPWSWRSRPRDPWRPSRAAVWLARWLLFRLMFSSAVVKLASHDPTWRNLTALQYHYETQPLPPWTAWYAHHLPPAFQSFSALMMFVIEGLVPLLIFAPRRLRMLAGAAIVFLQGLILLTGNYGFFNWLSLALCVMLLDDAAWPRRLAVRAAAGTGGGAPRPRRITAAFAVALGVLGIVPLAGALHAPPAALRPLTIAYGALEPFRTVNSYGLFAVMTTRRLEIGLEGSDDGVTWRAYGFRWKPGDPTRRPAFVPGHMPRLDWQMWFAALDPEHPAYWFLRLAKQILAGSKPVLGLLGENPFPARPPRYLRASLDLYHFSDAATRRASGVWWTREPMGAYLPPVRLEGDRLVLATEIAPAPAR